MWGASNRILGNADHDRLAVVSKDQRGRMLFGPGALGNHAI